MTRRLVSGVVVGALAAVFAGGLAAQPKADPKGYVADRMLRDLQSHMNLERQYAPLGLTRSEARVLVERLHQFQRALSLAERTGSYRQPRNPYNYYYGY